MKEVKFYLSHAGETIEISFAPTEFVYLQENLLSQFIKVWGSFLVRSKRADFRINVVPEETKDSVFVREGGKKYYFLTFLRDFRHNRVTTYYSAGIRNLDTLLKEVFAYLLEKDGFLLHCSSLKDKNGQLHAFLARSGGGKTTTASTLSGKGFAKFGDDIMIVRKLKGKWRFFSPPFIEKDRAPVKGESASARLCLVKKTKKAYLRRLEDRKKVLPFLLGQVWLRDGKLSKKTLVSVISFLKDNDFYELGAILNKKEMRKLIV